MLFIPSATILVACCGTLNATSTILRILRSQALFVSQAGAPTRHDDISLVGSLDVPWNPPVENRKNVDAGFGSRISAPILPYKDLESK